MTSYHLYKKKNITVALHCLLQSSIHSIIDSDELKPEFLIFGKKKKGRTAKWIFIFKRCSKTYILKHLSFIDEILYLFHSAVNIVKNKLYL